jgi:hypothetical protein
LRPNQPNSLPGHSGLLREFSRLNSTTARTDRRRYPLAIAAGLPRRHLAASSPLRPLRVGLVVNRPRHAIHCFYRSAGVPFLPRSLPFELEDDRPVFAHGPGAGLSPKRGAPRWLDLIAGPNPSSWTQAALKECDRKGLRVKGKSSAPSTTRTGELLVSRQMLNRIFSARKCLMTVGLVRPARLERATSWFVAVNTFVDPAQLTAQEDS